MMPCRPILKPKRQLLRPKPRLRRVATGALLVQGLLQSALPFTLISWSEQFIASGLAGVLNATPPLFVFLITSFITRDARRNRIPVDLESTFVVGPLLLTERFGRRDEHLVAGRAQTLCEFRDIYFRAAGGRWEIPAHRLDNTH